MAHQTLDIESLLQGTEYEHQAARLARIIRERGYDNTYSIHDLPQIGASFNVNVNLLLATILAQHEAAKAGDSESPLEDGNPEGSLEDGGSESPLEDEEVEAEAEVEATDAARELAAEKGIDLSQVDGSGQGGRIVKADVE